MPAPPKPPVEAEAVVLRSFAEVGGNVELLVNKEGYTGLLPNKVVELVPLAFPKSGLGCASGLGAVASGLEPADVPAPELPVKVKRLPGFALGAANPGAVFVVFPPDPNKLG